MFAAGYVLLLQFLLACLCVPSAAWMSPVAQRLDRNAPKSLPQSSHFKRSSTLGMSTTTTTTNQDQTFVLDTDFLSQLEVLPKLLVFDLDNTLWTPELYQLRIPNQRQGGMPQADRDICLFDDARRILEFFAAAPSTGDDMKLAIASRTTRTRWAHQLLQDFVVTTDSNERIPIQSLFGSNLVEIQKGSKKEHFAHLKQATGFAYTEMLFFDDNVSMNLKEISQLGVLCCHTPRGMTMEHFVKALQKYSDLKAGKDARHWMGYVLDSKNLDISPSASSGARKAGSQTSSSPPEGTVMMGRIKFFSPKKGFGFVIDNDNAVQDEYFFHESQVPAEMQGTLQAGHLVTFTLSEDRRRPGRWSATLDAFVNEAAGDDKRQPRTTETVDMPCFSMSQPFCSLLLNGVKTVESRKQPLFQDLPVGTKILVACGRRDWPDQETFRDILAKDSQDIPQWTRLPRGFSKGHVVGMVTLGPTRQVSYQERATDPNLHRQVLARGEGIGQYCTEISNPTWLAKSFSLPKGQPGVFTVQLPKDCLPSNQ